MKPSKVFKIQVNIRKPSDFGQAIGAISKAVTKAGRHNTVGIQVLGPEGTEEALGQELLQARQEIQELRALVKQQSEDPGARVEDPGSENEPPAKETKAEKKARLAAEKEAAE